MAQYEKAKVLETLKELLSANDRSTVLRPLLFCSCNGDWSWPFTDATIGYRKPKHSFRFEVWFQRFFIDIAQQLCGYKQSNIGDEDKHALKLLIDAFTDDHLKCLQNMLTESNEGKITAILAHHYFRPLVHDSTYLIDNRSQYCEKCKLCKDKFKYGDTTFGCNQGWHGRADIVLQKGVVKVTLEEKIAKVNLKDSKDQIMDECGTNSVCDPEVNLYKKPDDSNRIFRRKSKSQAIAQCIVSAFCEAKKDRSLLKKFIPSFLATEKHIRIILYNCDLDMLLMTKKCPIWKKGESELNFTTMMQVWFALNYSYQIDENTSERLLNHVSSSKFKELIGKSYSYYLDHVERPLKTEQIVVVDYNGNFDDEAWSIQMESLFAIFAVLKT